MLKRICILFCICSFVLLGFGVFVVDYLRSNRVTAYYKSMESSRKIEKVLSAQLSMLDPEKNEDKDSIIRIQKELNIIKENRLSDKLRFEEMAKPILFFKR